MKNKKLIASLTLAGFMAVSFVPNTGLAVAPAFADEATEVSVSASYLETADTNVTVDVNDKVEVKLGLLNKKNVAVTKEAGHKVYLWAESNSGRVDDALSLAKDATGANYVSKGIIEVQADKAEESKFDVTFARAGKYTLHAAYLTDYQARMFETDLKVADVRAYELTAPSDKKVVTVEAKSAVKAAKIDNEIVLDGQTAKKSVVVTKDNGVEKTPVKVTLYKDDKAADSVGRGVEVKVETNSNNIQLDKKVFTTDNSGSIEFNVTGTAQGDYKVYVTADKKEFTIPVTVSNAGRVDSLVQTKSEKAPISLDDVNKDNALADFVQFEFRDRNGSVVKNITSANEKVLEFGDYAKIIEKPAKSKLEGKDFRLQKVRDKENVYTVDARKDLVAGKYTIRFILDNGKYAEATFEVAEFGKAVSLKVDYDTETVTIGTTVNAPKIYFVDEKGVKKAAKDVNLGYVGYAVDIFNYTKDEAGKLPGDAGTFSVKNDEKYLGSKITVTAVSSRYNFVATTDLTVAQDGRALKFATNSGVINRNNTVDFQIVDGAGKTVSIGSVSNNNGVNAIVVSSSNKDARITTNIKKDDIDALKGTGKFTVMSDKATTAEIQVFVRDNKNQYYAGTVTYTFGETAGNGNVNRFVVLSIGSDIANINNTTVKIDAAPIVKSNRTFVPFRTVAEAFGAEVGYDDKTKKVTTKLDGKVLELVLNSKTLKVGDKEKQMDVAPFAQNSRTMVPVRFVAEELGFKVTAVRDAKKGGTAAVVFSR